VSEPYISIVIFDVNETLLDIAALEPMFKRLFDDPLVLREWFAQLILYSQAMTLSGLYTPFDKLASGTLSMVAATRGMKVSQADTAELGDRIANLPAHDDVIPALTKLRDAGIRLVTLTNSASVSPPSPLEKADIGGFFEHNFSVEVVQKFKPAPETYRFVAEEMGAELREMVLVACHLWDTIGAQASGCRGGFVARTGNAILPAENVPVPDFTAPDLGALVDQILQTR
jgi:2-haloacid dehalogenase